MPSFEIPANLISFVEAGAYFLLPRYIAVRFNLRITHVHRGILIGTGPLVDPGFWGRLLVPLNNLTNEPYVLRRDEGFIWVEFTKTTHRRSTLASLAGGAGERDRWEKGHSDRSIEYYLDRANKNRPIRSSIPDAIGQAKASAALASRNAARAAKANQVFVGLGSVAIVATAIGLLSLMETVKGNLHSTVSLTRDVSLSAARAEKDAQDALMRTEAKPSTSARVDRLERQVERLRSELDRLEGRVPERSAPQPDVAPARP